ncbi:MAG: urea ABC transporter ATP-binding subunit UrtE [Gammaproteobacteria bacterium]|nr:urea ABC transporter ATP-binding subunit UrtE [Gammaproteobacteria bacterium]
MFTVNKLNQYYGQSHTLWDLDFEIPAKSCTCVLGRNGVGKTTLMQCLMGLAPKISGEILFDGKDLVTMDVEKRASMGIAYIPQGRQIFAQLTVEENIRTGFFASRAGHTSVPSSVYDLFPVLKEMRNRRGGDLSGGQQQQLAIARALVLDPTVLIMDEPAEGIQPSIVQEIGDVITRLNQDHDMTIVLVEQKLPFARRVGNQFIILDRGRLMAKGKMPELDDALVKKYLTV